MKISVALATYNGSEYLQDQLDSLVGQSRLPDEVVICDDRSTDSTQQIIADFAKRAPFPVDVMFHSKHLGISGNFSFAIGRCKGDLIALCDQDDIWLPEKLQVTEATLIENDWADYVFSDAWVVDEGQTCRGTLWDAVSFTPRERQHFIAGRQVEVLLKRNVVTGATMVFRASLKGLVLGVPSGWVHDAWIALLASAARTSGLPIERSLISYRQHQQQAVGIPSRDWRRRIQDVRARSSKAFEKEARALQFAKQRLSERGYRLEKVEVQISEKIAHLQARSEIHRSALPTRLRLMSTELSQGRYRRYSGYGMRTAVRDMLFRP